MKRANKMLFLAALAGMVSFAASPAYAMTDRQEAAIEKALLKTPAIELAAKSVDFVTKATANDRKATAVLAVRTSVKKNPASAPSVVSAICSIAPDLAPKLMAVVAEVAPDQSAATAKIIARVAPEQVGQVSLEISEAAPKTLATINAAMAEEKAAAAKVSAESDKAQTIANSGRAFPPGSGGVIRKFTTPINPRLVFPIVPPKSVSNYAAPGADPNRP